VVAAADDIYSLGVVLYDAFTNDRIFRRPSLAETKSAILRAEFERLKESVEYVNEIIDELIWQMMSRFPVSRPESAAQVEQALRSQLRQGDEVMVGKLAELMQRMFASEMSSGRQAIDVARRKIDRSSRAEDMPMALPSAALNDGDAHLDDETPVPLLIRKSTSESEPLKASDLLAEAPEVKSCAAGPSDPTEPTRVPPPLPKRSPSGASGSAVKTPGTSRPRSNPTARPISKPIPKETKAQPPIPKDRPTSASGEAQIAGARPRTASPSPFRISRFDVRVDLGRVGVCATYEARSIDKEETAYLKVLDAEKIDDARLTPHQWTLLFEREIALAETIHDPGLPVLLEAGQQGALRYVAYHRSPSVPLSVMVGRGRLPPANAVRKIISKAALALHHLHERDFVYANVQAQGIHLLRDGSSLLNDLSLASPTAGPTHPLLSANIFALSPEYLGGNEYLPASDQFALGALLYELLTGTRPFRGLDDRAILSLIREKDPLAPRTVDSKVDAVLAELAMKMLQKDPKNRLASCADVAEQLSEGD
jgi:serine/threonine protein kinase